MVGRPDLGDVYIERFDMKRLSLAIVLVGMAAFSTSAVADMRPAVGMAQPVAAANQSTIPPNCTLDPWTGRLTCHIWPTCTLDPWTGKMNCPVPRLERLF